MRWNGTWSWSTESSRRRLWDKNMWLRWLLRAVSFLYSMYLFFHLVFHFDLSLSKWICICSEFSSFLNTSAKSFLDSSSLDGYILSQSNFGCVFRALEVACIICLPLSAFVHRLPYAVGYANSMLFLTRWLCSSLSCASAIAWRISALYPSIDLFIECHVIPSLDLFLKETAGPFSARDSKSFLLSHYMVSYCMPSWRYNSASAQHRTYDGQHSPKFSTLRFKLISV